MGGDTSNPRAANTRTTLNIPDFPVTAVTATLQFKMSSRIHAHRCRRTRATKRIATAAVATIAIACLPSQNQRCVAAHTNGCAASTRYAINTMRQRSCCNVLLLQGFTPFNSGEDHLERVARARIRSLTHVVNSCRSYGRTRSGVVRRIPIYVSVPKLIAIIFFSKIFT
jgi:hypothetical protein